MYITLVTLCLCFTAVFGHAQNEKVKQLEEDLLNATTDFEQAKANYFLANHYRSTNVPKARDYIIQCLSTIKRTDRLLHIGKAYYLAGFIERDLANTTDSYSHLLYAAYYFEQCSDSTNLAKSQLALATTLLEFNELTEATIYLENLAYSNLKKSIKEDLAQLYRLLGKALQAKKMHKEAINKLKKSRGLSAEPHVANVLLTISYLETAQFNEAATLIKESLAQLPPQSPLHTSMLIEKAFLLEYQGQYQQALALLNNLPAEALQDADLLAAALYRKVKLYQQLEQPNQAYAQTQRLQQVCQQFGLYNQLLHFSPTMAQVAQAAGQPNQAIAMLNNLVTLKDTLQLPQQVEMLQGRRAIAQAQKAFVAQQKAAAVGFKLDQETNYSNLVSNLLVALAILLVVVLAAVLWVSIRYWSMLRLLIPAFHQNPLRARGVVRLAYYILFDKMLGLPPDPDMPIDELDEFYENARRAKAKNNKGIQKKSWFVKMYNEEDTDT